MSYLTSPYATVSKKCCQKQINARQRLKNKFTVLRVRGQLRYKRFFLWSLYDFSILSLKWFKSLTRTLTNCVLLPALTLPQGCKVKGSSSMRRPVTNAHNQINSVYIRALRANWIEIQTAGTTERLESRRARLFMASP